MLEGTCTVNEPICPASLNGDLYETMGSSPPSTSYRPRGSLARALYVKQQSDEYLKSFDKSQWYNCDLTLIPQEISEKFIHLEMDEDGLNFLQQSEEKSERIFTQIWHSFVKTFLGWFMTQTSINGWLQRGSMFVVSFQQFLKLVGHGEKYYVDTLLDLGAGDGEVTARLAPAFRKVYVTEVSNTMQILLQRRNYELLPIDSWQTEQSYDMISCLNLLDRCDKPLQLLQQIHTALKSNGLLLLGLVLPFSSYVESGNADHKPTEQLPIMGSNFEQQLTSLISNVLIPEGFKVRYWSRVPYLCEGDLQQSYYWLDDCILVLEKS